MEQVSGQSYCPSPRKKNNPDFGAYLGVLKTFAVTSIVNLHYIYIYELFRYRQVQNQVIREFRVTSFDKNDLTFP